MPRSTRNKVRFQIVKAADSLDRSMEHLKNAADMANGGSTPINEFMSDLVNMLVAAKGALLKFRGKL